jgi:hypothetical protein
MYPDFLFPLLILELSPRFPFFLPSCAPFTYQPFHFVFLLEDGLSECWMAWRHNRKQNQWKRDDLVWNKKASQATDLWPAPMPQNFIASQFTHWRNSRERLTLQNISNIVKSLNVMTAPSTEEHYTLCLVLHRKNSLDQKCVPKLNAMASYAKE